jgi:hypothetical protein
LAHGLLLIDVGDPANPIEMGRLRVPERLIAVDIYGGLVYVRREDGILWAIDTTEPSAPQVASSYDPPGKTLSGEIYANLVSVMRQQLIDGRIPSFARVQWFAYFADLDGGLRWLELLPDGMAEIGALEHLDQAAHVALTRKRVFAFSVTQDLSYGQRELGEFPLVDPRPDTDVGIRELGTISLPDEIRAETVCRFVDDFLNLLQHSSPDPVSHAGARPAEIGNFLQGVVAVGDRLMLASADGELQIYDMLPAQKSFTYRSDPGGFSIDYPNGFILYEDEAPSVDGVVAETPDSTSILGWGGAAGTFLLRIQYQQMADGVDFESLMIEVLGGCAVMGEGLDMEVAGIPSLLFPDTPCGVRGALSIIYVPRGDLVYRISVESNLPYEQIQHEVSELLTGFRLME